jgi:hypothetical protein
MVSKSSNLLPFKSIFCFGNERSHTVQSRKNMEVAARVGFCVWLRNVAQVERNTLIRCLRGFARSLTITFLDSCGVLRSWEATKLVNYIPHFLHDSVKRTHDEQHRLDRRKLLATSLLCFELGVAFHRRSHFFKTVKSFKNLSTAHGILS